MPINTLMGEWKSTFLEVLYYCYICKSVQISNGFGSSIQPKVKMPKLPRNAESRYKYQISAC